ncbi:MAG: hypothetical protein ACYCUI_11200, partial [Vulcanimicrobiaceae bacterium]
MRYDALDSKGTTTETTGAIDFGSNKPASGKSAITDFHSHRSRRAELPHRALLDDILLLHLLTLRG